MGNKSVSLGCYFSSAQAESLGHCASTSQDLKDSKITDANIHNLIQTKSITCLKARIVQLIISWLVTNQEVQFKCNSFDFMSITSSSKLSVIISSALYMAHHLSLELKVAVFPCNYLCMRVQWFYCAAERINILQGYSKTGDTPNKNITLKLDCRSEPHLAHK